MNCTNCGNQIEEGGSFCANCGTKIEIQNETTKNVEKVAEESVEQPEINNNSANTGNGGFLNFFTYTIGTLLKPFEIFKKNEEELKDPRNAFILTGIVSIVMMIVNFIKTVLSTVIVKQYNFMTGEYKTGIELEALKDLDFMQLIVKNFLVYIAIILAVAAVYYLGSLVAKKSPSFIRLVSISATAFIPYVLLTVILSPILGKVWSDLGFISTVIGIIYSIVIFVYLANEEIAFDNKSHSLYFNLACVTTLLLIAYYVGIKAITSGILNMFN